MLSKIKEIKLPKISDPRGNLSFFESLNHVPFKIERTYWVYDVPGGEVRGSHAFKEAEEFIVCLSGSFDLVLHDGYKEQIISLNRSYKGVYIPNMTWRKMNNFATNTVVLIVSSTNYSEDDYIRDFETFTNSNKLNCEE